jgi:hypothetical protein
MDVDFLNQCLKATLNFTVPSKAWTVWRMITTVTAIGKTPKMVFSSHNCLSLITT